MWTGPTGVSDDVDEYGSFVQRKRPTTAKVEGDRFHPGLLSDETLPPEPVWAQPAPSWFASPQPTKSMRHVGPVQDPADLSPSPIQRRRERESRKPLLEQALNRIDLLDAKLAAHKPLLKQALTRIDQLEAKLAALEGRLTAATHCPRSVASAVPAFTASVTTELATDNSDHIRRAGATTRAQAAVSDLASLSGDDLESILRGLQTPTHASHHKPA
jgi:BMFP domain-containing protein YqiC